MMKSKLTLVSTLLAGALSCAVGLRAQNMADHMAHPDSSALSKDSGKVSISHVGMTALYGHIREIEASLNTGKLDGMHEHAEAIQASVKDLDKEPNLEPAKKKRVQGYVKNIARLAGKMHDAADANKLDQTKKEFSKLKVQVDLLDKQFAHSHKPKDGDHHEDSANHQESGK